MDNLVWVVATTADFQRAGIPLTTERISLDGTKAIKHINTLTVEEWNAIRSDLAFQFLGEEGCTEMLTGAEWTE